MKRKFKLLFKSSFGFSLTEVLIAIVILGLVGATVINGVTTDSKVRNKTNINTNRNIDIDSVAEKIQSSNLEYANCDPNAKNYYENTYKSEFPDVVIIKIEGLKLTTPTGWVDCSITSAETSIQKIYLTTRHSDANLKKYQKIIIKTDVSTNSEVQSPFEIKADKSDIKVASSGLYNCASSDTVHLSNSLSSSQVIYVAISDSTSIATASVSDSVLTVTGGLPGSTTINILGVSVNQDSITSTPIQISVNVLSPISFASTDERISVLQHRRILNIPNIKNLASVPTGYSFNIELIDSTSPFQLTSANNGTFDWKVPNLSENVGLYSNQIKISISGLPNSSGCTSTMWRIPVRIKPALTFSLNLSSDRCILGTDISCSIPVIASEGSGSGIIADPNINRYSNGKLSIIGAACSTPFTSFSGGASNVPGSSNQKIQIALSLTTAQITTLKMATQASLTFSKNKGKLPPPLIYYNIFSVTSDPATALTYVVLEGGSYDVTGLSPSSLQLVTFNDISPVLYDNNFSSSGQGTSYSVTSTNKLPISCN